MTKNSSPSFRVSKKLGDERYAEATAKAREYLVTKLGNGPITLQATAIYTSGTKT